ncbi:2-amino-4-hydroxy-6- hydroxymethyldihydropteridine pyrophosphokinase [Chlamydiales bacterium STE3]|nr:2-amino-4-hydroxy-6- hydroxymethyldihydropteridine pyrophosphokinase [Chlamydiales bacterium STE3]
MQQVYVSLGSNLGTPLLTIKQALDAIAALKEISFFRASRFYETEPLSDIPQDFFVNAVCAFLSPMPAEKILCQLQEIETSLGKVPKPKDAPRIIDLDLLFVGHEVRCTPELYLPHPEWKKRRFVLEPLADLEESITFMEDGKLTELNIQKFLESFSTSNKVRVIV